MTTKKNKKKVLTGLLATGLLAPVIPRKPKTTDKKWRGITSYKSVLGHLPIIGRYFPSWFTWKYPSGTYVQINVLGKPVHQHFYPRKKKTRYL